MTSSSHETQNNQVQINTAVSADQSSALAENQQQGQNPELKVNELGGPKGPEPTRFGDWERKGRCVDF